MKYFFLLVLFPVSNLWATPQGKAFDLYPPANDATPVVYSKTAKPFQSDGKNWKFAYGTPVTITIDAGQTLRSVTPYQFGNNVAWWDSRTWFLDPDRIEKAKQAGIKFWRWPGGSSADIYHWDGDYQRGPKDSKDNLSNMNAAWAVSTDNFIDFCRQTGSEAIVTINYGAARYESVQFAADMAARWVKYFNLEKKFKVRYWEIGNENYGPWEEGNKIEGKAQLTGEDYGKDFPVIADAMRKVDPDLFIGAVAVDMDSGDDWSGYHWWMKGLLPELQGKADYLILHQYFMWPFSGDTYTNPSDEVLLGNLHKLADAKSATDQMVEKYAEKEKGIPIALTEFNISNGNDSGVPPQTIELINGLFISEVLGESLKSGYVASNYWDWKNGLGKTLKGDHALLASGDPSTTDGTPRPSYYSYALFSRAFGDRLMPADSSDSTLRVYASRFSSGELGLVFVNESDKNKTAVFSLKSFIPKGKLMGWVLTGKSLDETQVSWNGVEGPLGGGGPFPIDYIPPYRVSFKTDKPLQLAIQARSVTGVILY